VNGAVAAGQTYFASYFPDTALVLLHMCHSAVASAYGAAGTLIVLLLRLYYSAQVLLLGAEFPASMRGIGRELEPVYLSLA
jgi:membrane protein